jgi:hypothetical protein
MKNTIKLTGIALIAAITIVFASCGGDDAGSKGTAPTITTATLPGGTVGTAYSQTLEATGDTPITWSIDTGSGALPGGLTLSTAGVISGTPTTTGIFSFTVKAANAAGNVTKQLSIAIAETTFKMVQGEGSNSWLYTCDVSSSVTGGKITEGDIHTLTYSFKSNVSVTGAITLYLADTSNDYTVLSDYSDISGITANTVKSGKINLSANKSASFAVNTANQLVFSINPASNVASQPELSFSVFSLEKTGIENKPSIIPLIRTTGSCYDNWQYLYYMPSSLTGGKITKGDMYTFKLTFKSNVAIADRLMVFLVDSNNGWNLLSDYNNVPGITADIEMTRTINLVAGKSASSEDFWANQLVFQVDPASNAASQPVLAFTVFSIEKTISENEGVKKITLGQNTGPGFDNWQFLYNIPSRITGGKITKGDTYTFTYSFTSNVNITKLEMCLVDNSEAGGWWTLLSGDNKASVENITANVPVSGTIEFIAEKTASSTDADANKMQFVVDPISGAQGEPTLTFITFTLVKK